MPEKVVIVGAGVIGAACALAIQADGHEVTIIDREAPCAGASFGNAGVIVDSSCVPTAMPGIIFDVIRMQGQKYPPLSIRPDYLHKILPWLIRFVWQSRPAAATANGTHLHALTAHAVQAWHQLSDGTTLRSLIRESGWLKVYESESAFAATSKARALMDQIGTKYEVLNGAQVHDLEPNLAPIFKFGCYQKDCLRILNPQRLVQDMVDLLVERGGSYKQFDVHSLDVENDLVSLHGPAGNLTCGRVLIATGAWSRTLAKQLGDDVPLDTERGYHLMLQPSTAALLNSAVVNGDSSFVLSPMETGIRLTSQIEFAGLTAAPDYRRVRSLLPAAKRMLPGLDDREISVWMGLRPSLPDSLPVLGFSSRSKRVLYAFGHQHLGMTMAAITGLLMADVLADRKPVVDLAPYEPGRF